MKKMLLGVLGILGIALLSGCKDNNDEIIAEKEYIPVEQFNSPCDNDVCLVSEYDIYNQGTLQVTLQWTNTKYTKMGPSENYILEEKIDGNWKSVNGSTLPKTESGVITFIDKGDTFENAYPIIEFVYGLEQGEYRIATTYWIGNTVPYEPIYANFIVNDIGEIDYSLEAQEKYWPTGTELEQSRDDIKMESLYSTYPVGISEVTVQLVNDTFDQVTYGEMFVLEKMVENEWKVVQKDLGTGAEIAFVDIGYLLNPKSIMEHQYNLSYMSDPLQLGQYRIRAKYSMDTIDGNIVRYPDNRFEYVTYFEVSDNYVERELSIIDFDMSIHLDIFDDVQLSRLDINTSNVLEAITLTDEEIVALTNDLNDIIKGFYFKVEDDWEIPYSFKIEYLSTETNNIEVYIAGDSIQDSQVVFVGLAEELGRVVFFDKEFVKEFNSSH